MTKLLSALLFSALTLTPAMAQETPTASALSVELNALQSSEAGCRVSFLATNELGDTLDRAAIEVAFFSTDGAIDRIVTLDFTALTQGKTKVLQFELKDLPCDQIGRLLINDITACEAQTLPPTACLAGLVATSRPDIVFGI
jgi:hypothetical protein